jgi:hypothetical protein
MTSQKPGRRKVVVTSGNHQIQFRLFDKLPVRERYSPIFGKIEESRSYIEIGREDSYQLKTYYFGFGRFVFTYMRFVPDYCPPWLKLPEVETKAPLNVPVKKPNPALFVVKDRK